MATLVAGLVLASALTGCGGDGVTDGTPTPFADPGTPASIAASVGAPTTPGGSTAPAGSGRLSRAAAERALTTAYAAHRAADTALFTQVTSLATGSADRLEITQAGRYRMSAGSAEVTLTQVATGRVRQKLGDPAGPFVLRTLRGATYLNTTSWPVAMRRCWLRSSAADLARQAGMEAKVIPGAPVLNLWTLSTARATSGTVAGDRTTISATVDAAAALQLFGTGTTAMVDKPAAFTGRLPATLVVSRAGIESFAMAGGSLAALLRSTGQSADAAALQIVGLLRVRVGYEGHGAKVAVVAPPADLQITGSQTSC